MSGIQFDPLIFQLMKKGFFLKGAGGGGGGSCLFLLVLSAWLKNKSETKLTVSVLKLDPNIQNVERLF